MINNEIISTPQSKALIESWDRQLKALDAQLRASGRTVEVVEGSDGDLLTATIPQGRRPSSEVSAAPVDPAIGLERSIQQRFGKQSTTEK